MSKRDKFIQPAAGIRIVERGPIGQALDAAQTALRLLDQLHEDDPGDHEPHNAPRLARARQHALNLIAELKEIA